MKNRITKTLTSVQRKIRGIAKSKNTIKLTKILAFIFLIHICYSVYSLYKYNQFEIDRKDIKIKSIIKSKFPVDYDVNIKLADLVGLGDKFYVAYGNKKYVKNAYFMGGDSVISNIKQNLGKFNLPLLKIFYIKEPGLISALFSVTPFINVLNSIFELSIKEYTSSSFIPQDPEDESLSVINYNTQYRFPATFMINSVKILDIDDDNKDEIIVTYLSYSGGSGGIKYSIIIQLVDDKLSVTSGYPEVLDIEFSKFLHSISKFGGFENPLDRNEKILRHVLNIFSSIYEIDSVKRELIERQILPENRLATILLESKQSRPFDTTTLLDYYTKQKVSVTTRHTDDFSEFVNIDGNILYIDSYYVEDNDCHWCPHYWRLMSFLCKDGRWISDRNVNGDYFVGLWLDEKKVFTINEVFGTYPDQGIAGIAHSFLNSDWTESSKFKLSDPYGIEMRTQSPVIKKVAQIYSKGF